MVARGTVLLQLRQEEAVRGNVASLHLAGNHPLAGMCMQSGGRPRWRVAVSIDHAAAPVN